MILILTASSCNILIIRVWLFAEREGWWFLKVSIWMSLCTEVFLLFVEGKEQCVWVCVCVGWWLYRESTAWGLPPFTSILKEQLIASETLWYSEHKQCCCKNQVTVVAWFLPLSPAPLLLIGGQLREHWDNPLDTSTDSLMEGLSSSGSGKLPAASDVQALDFQEKVWAQEQR